MGVTEKKKEKKTTEQEENIYALFHKHLDKCKGEKRGHNGHENVDCNKWELVKEQ